MNVETSQQRRAAKPVPRTPAEPEQTLADWEPGAGDITFPGVNEDQLPKWMRAVLKRIHTNLGHPHNSAMVRQLSQANATPMALMGARALKCAVCERLRPPRQQRPAKSFPITKRFNERVMLDLLYAKDSAGETFVFLNQVDDAITYQVLTLLPGRESQHINKALVNGWFRFFGFPESLLIDAEGAMKSFDFEELMAQSGIMIRFVPPDAHYQLGKGERHGDIVREIMHRLIHQHGIIGSDSMDIAATMSTHAKNSLTRRAGASPAQWVLGQNPRLPASLISETENAEAMHQLTLSRRLQMIEQVRHDAMKIFLDFDNDASLRQAMLRRPRPWRGPFEVGQKAVYWRLRNSLDNEGAQPGYRQGIILAADPGPTGSLWLRNDRGRVVQVSREQVRNLQGEEAWIPGEADFALLRHAELDLDKKHASQLDLRDSQLPALPAPVPEPAPVVQPELPALEDISAPQTPNVPGISGSREELIHDAPLDPAGKPLEHEPMQDSVLRPEPQPDMTSARSSRRPSVTSAPQEPDVKKLKVTPSAPSSSRRSSFASIPDESMERQMTNVSNLPPVPEDDDLQYATPREEAHVGPLQAQGDDKVSKQPTLLVHNTFTISSKSFCRFCGCLDKQIEAGKTQCSRCLSFDFTDHPDQVQSWFDEDVEYDARVRRWRNHEMTQLEDVHLPDQNELKTIWQTGVWHNNEVHRGIEGDGVPASSTRSLLRSIARWSKRMKSWIWCTLVNAEVDSNMFDSPPETSTEMITIYHASQSRNRHTRPHRVKQHKFLLKRHQPEQVWLLRHGRSDAFLNGWDGSSKEFQTLFQGQQHFSWACHLAEWEDELKSGQISTSKRSTLTFQAYVTATDTFHPLPDTSDEEDSGLKRTQRQALKREVPWKSIGAADQPAFIEAMEKEWNEWKKWSSCQKFTGDVESIPKELILPSRVCYRWKPIDGGSSFKAKARIVIQGFKDPHLPLLSRDAPVLSRLGLMCLLQWASSLNLDLWNADCKSAFLQGKPDNERPQKIYMQVPQDGIALAAVVEWANNPKQLYELHAPVYGQANAPRQWFLHVLDVMTRLSWVQHSLDPCIFLFKNTEGMVIAALGIHVDDILACALPGQESVLKEVEKSFFWGGPWEKNDFVFVGRRIVKHDTGKITLSQSHYAMDVIVTKNKNNPEDKMGADREAMSEFRSAIGSLQWMAGTTRPDICADTSLLQKAHDSLTYGDLQEANTVLKYCKATADTHVTIQPINLDEMILVAFGDSAFANAPGGKSQGGFIITATTEKVTTGEAEASLPDWKSYRHQRVLRSTLAAEAASLDKSEDYANFLGCMLGEIATPGYIASHSGKSPFPIWPVTDARSLFDAIHRLATSFTENELK